MERKIFALIMVELKKLIRDPMNLAVLVLMPVGLTLIFFFALGNIYNDYYPVPGMTHFDYLLPGIMGYSVIYMGMMVALALCDYRKDGILNRIETTPVSAGTYLGSQIIANMIIATVQGLLVLLMARILGFVPLGGFAGLLIAVLFLAILSVSAVAFGLITASIAKDSGAASGLSMIFILPMMMFGSLLAVFNEATRSIAKFTPNYYVSESLSLIFHEGKVSDPVVWQNLMVLTFISIVLVYVGIRLFSRTTFRTSETDITATKSKSVRLFFVDHWRAFLAIVVVLHHVSLVYGASLDGYYYVEPPYNNANAFTWLLIFVLFNQGWFMGAFFLLAGHFVPKSYDKKGWATFIKKKLMHLGLPLLVFVFVLSPISFIGYFLMPPELTGITTKMTWDVFWYIYPDTLSLGPTWFLAMLLVFNIGYVIWRRMTRKLEFQEKITPPSYLAIFTFILALAGISYVWRMVVPMGKTILQFPTLAYLPQYLSFYVIGIVASRRNWFTLLSNKMGGFGWVMALVASVLLFPLAISGKMFTFEITDVLNNSMGNGHWQSAVYSIWDSILAVGLCLGMVVLFRQFFGKENWLGSFLARHSYTVYIIHIPIIVFVAYGLRTISIDPIAKFGLASLIIVPLCFIVAALIRKVLLISKMI